jgi:hypothetical protein
MEHICNISDYILRPKKELTSLNARFNSNRAGEFPLKQSTCQKGEIPAIRKLMAADGRDGYRMALQTALEFPVLRV